MTLIRSLLHKFTVDFPMHLSFCLHNSERIYDQQPDCQCHLQSGWCAVIEWVGSGEKDTTEFRSRPDRPIDPEEPCQERRSGDFFFVNRTRGGKLESTTKNGKYIYIQSLVKHWG